VDSTVTCRIYYEDTDCLGIVYHANYLKYLERGRTEFIEAAGKGIAQWNEEGLYFVVYSMNIRFKKAASLGDRLDVISSFRADTDFRGVFHQRIERGGELIVEARVEVVCLDRSRELREFPEPFKTMR